MNAKILPKKVKFRLGKLLEQAMRIKGGAVFNASVKLSSDSWKKGKEILNANIGFEMLMADYELKKITDSVFGKRAAELVERYPPLVYQMSFQEKMILGVMV